MIKALICDLDGTLCDTRVAISHVMRETFRHFGEYEPAVEAIEMTLTLGTTLEETFQALAPSIICNAATCAAWVKVYRQIYNSGEGVAATELYPNVIELLDSLHDAGVSVVVVSNKGEEAVWNALRHFGIATKVLGVIAAKDELATKPAPASFAERIRPLYPALSNEEFLVFGDTIADVRYARAIGARVAWASYGYGNHAECEALSPDATVMDACELAPLIASWNAAKRSETDVRIVADVVTLMAQPELQLLFNSFCQPSTDRATAQRAISEITRILLKSILPEIVQPDLIVAIARAGVAMLGVAAEMLAVPAICFAIGSKVKGTGEVRVELSTSPSTATSILVLDTVVASGDTVLRTAEMLRERYAGVPLALATCYASPKALARIAGLGMYATVGAAVRATDCVDGWLVPKINGDAGEKLFGSRSGS